MKLSSALILLPATYSLSLGATASTEKEHEFAHTCQPTNEVMFTYNGWIRLQTNIKGTVVRPVKKGWLASDGCRIMVNGIAWNYSWSRMKSITVLPSPNGATILPASTPTPVTSKLKTASIATLATTGVKQATPPLPESSKRPPPPATANLIAPQTPPESSVSSTAPVSTPVATVAGENSENEISHKPVESAKHVEGAAGGAVSENLSDDAASSVASGGDSGIESSVNSAANVDKSLKSERMALTGQSPASDKVGSTPQEMSPVQPGNGGKEPGQSFSEDALTEISSSLAIDAEDSLPVVEAATLTAKSCEAQKADFEFSKVAGDVCEFVIPETEERFTAAAKDGAALAAASAFVLQKCKQKSLSVCTLNSSSGDLRFLKSDIFDGKTLKATDLIRAIQLALKCIQAIRDYPGENTTTRRSFVRASPSKCTIHGAKGYGEVDEANLTKEGIHSALNPPKK